MKPLPLPVARPWLQVMLMACASGVLAFLLLLDVRAQWWGWWPSVWARSTTAIILAAPLAACFGAYLSRPLRSGEWALITAASGSSPERRLLPLAAAAWGSVAVGYAAALSLMLAWGAESAGWGGVIWAPVLIAVDACAYLGFAAAAGVGLGLVLPGWAAIGVSASAFVALYAVPLYVTVFWASPVEDAILAATHVYVGSDWSTSMPSVVALSAATALHALITAALFAGVAARGSHAMTLLVAASLAATVLLWTGGAARAIPEGSRQLCDSRSPRICMSGSYRAVAGQFNDVVRSQSELLPREFRPKVVLSEDALSEREPSWGALVFSPVNGRTLPARYMDVRATERAFLPAFLQQRCAEPASPSPTSTETRIYAYWRVHDGGIEVGSLDPAEDAPVQVGAADLQEARHVLARSKAEQHRWVRDRLVELGCRTA